MNPVAIRELEERFRTVRSPLLLSVWVLVAGALTFLAYLLARSAADAALSDVGFAGIGSVLASNSMGVFIFEMIMVLLMTGVVFVVPGQAAVTIVGERDRQTLQLLQVSQLSATSVVVGKLISSLSYILLLVVATTPLLVIPVLLGGVTIGQVAGALGMLIAASVMIGAVSMWVSARAKSVQGAVLGSYLWAAMLVFGTLALLAGEFLLFAPDDTGRARFDGGRARDDGRELYMAWINPYLGMIDASSDTLTIREELLFSPYVPFEGVLLKRQGYAYGTAFDLAGSFAIDSDNTFTSNDFGSTLFNQQQTFRTRTVDPKRSSLWWRTLAFEAIVTVVALFAASRLIKVPRRRVRIRRSREVTTDA
ncbi:MAG: ABC transporter permease subunit [Acidimicrobiia bacterium]|nr:ABC transporter permease subunit [Acidimicrobiia bacterium]